MINMSFYNGSLDKKVAIEGIKTTHKPITLTVGFAYRNPTIHNKPITVQEALSIINKESFVDIKECETCISVNVYSANDMY
jgi:hypothetical protein